MLSLNVPNEPRYCTIHQYNTQESSNSTDSNNSAQLTEMVTSNQDRNIRSDGSSPITTDMVLIMINAII